VRPCFLEAGVTTPPITAMGVRIAHLIRSDRADRSDVLRDAARCGTSLAGRRGSSSTGPVVYRIVYAYILHIFTIHIAKRVYRWYTA
jgi:hypothetical protein